MHRRAPDFNQDGLALNLLKAIASVPGWLGTRGGRPRD